MARTFEALQDETEWIAMREILPSASAPLTVAGHEDREVVLSTVLPMAWPGMVRSDGRVMVALQVVTRSGDPSRDLAQVIQQALAAAPGSSIVPTTIATDGPRLEDVLVPGPLGLTLHDGYDHWLEGVVTERTGEVAESMERANASVIPTRALTRFGATAREWINSMITSVIETSAGEGKVTMDPDDLGVMNELRDFMFERVYLSPALSAEKNRAIKVIRDLVEYFAAHPDEVPDTYTVPDADPLTRAIDYVAGMTDRYALRTHDRLFRPTLF